MKNQTAVTAFSALAQETRLSIFRLLITRAPAGLLAGEIARTLSIAPSTLSGHLGILKRAGLLHSSRQHREIRYQADITAMNSLIGFMLKDCCNGQAENCSEILSLLN